MDEMAEGLNLSALYFQSNLKEYRLAFDMAANDAQKGGRSIIALVDSPQWGLELARRCTSSLSFAATCEFDAFHFGKMAQAWTQVDLSIFDYEDQAEDHNIIWVAPQKESLATKLALLQTLNRYPSLLVVIAPGGLHRFLPGADQQFTSPGGITSSANITRQLRQHGWRLKTRYGLHGIRSILYSLGARASGVFGRPDWHDRLIYTSRCFYHETGLFWPLSTVIVSTFQKVN